jgi:hypothetical protein
LRNVDLGPSIKAQRSFYRVHSLSSSDIFMLRLYFSLPAGPLISHVSDHIPCPPLRPALVLLPLQVLHLVLLHPLSLRILAPDSEAGDTGMFAADTLSAVSSREIEPPIERKSLHLPNDLSGEADIVEQGEEE